MQKANRDFLNESDFARGEPAGRAGENLEIDRSASLPSPGCELDRNSTGQMAPELPGGAVRDPIVGTSAALRTVWRQVDIFAPTDISILLTGESGTGKELFARAIHRLSKRSRCPFIEVDCASIPESLLEAELFGHERGAFTDAREARKGKFELASGGTLFLDELGNLSLGAQAKLLRVVQERAFRRVGGAALMQADVRIIGATNLDLWSAVERQTFRSDLFYRLAETHICLPPLRDRAGDLQALFDRFVSSYSNALAKHVRGVTPATLAILERHRWPGNIRELKNVARAATLMATDLIEPSHLPAYFPRDGCLSRVIQLDQKHAADAPVLDPLAEGAIDDFWVRIPWRPRDRGLDLKALHQQIRRDLDRHMLTALKNAGLNKTEISRYLGLDYKVVLDKFKELGAI